MHFNGSHSHCTSKEPNFSAEPVASAEGDAFSFVWVAKRFNLIMLVAVDHLRKLSGASTHISTLETPWDLSVRKTVPVFSPGSPTTLINMLLAWNTLSAFNRYTLTPNFLGQYSTFPILLRYGHINYSVPDCNHFKSHNHKCYSELAKVLMLMRWSTAW